MLTAIPRNDHFLLFYLIKILYSDAVQQVKKFQLFIIIKYTDFFFVSIAELVELTNRRGSRVSRFQRSQSRFSYYRLMLIPKYILAHTALAAPRTSRASGLRAERRVTTW